MSIIPKFISPVLKPNPQILSLGKVIQLSRRRRTKANGEVWLFLPVERDKLTPDTKSGLGWVQVDEDELKEIIPDIFFEHELTSSIPFADIQNCVEWADKLKGQKIY